MDFTLPASAPAWIQVFDSVAQTGVGAYVLSPVSLPGDENSGVLRMQWAAYTADPYTCGSCFAGSLYEDFPYRVAVATPEPGTLWLVLVAAGVLRVCSKKTLDVTI